jgi:hypothetical protein
MRRIDTTRLRDLTAFFAAALAIGSLFGCAQQAADDVRRRAEPFTSTRDQAISAVVSARLLLPSASLSQFQTCYADVQAKGNAYAGFLVALVSDGTYDDAANAALSQQLGGAIGAFDDCELKLQRAGAAQPSPLPVLSADWVSGFSASVADYWRRDQKRMQALSPAEKYDLIHGLSAALMFPDFESIRPDSQP